MTTEHNPLDFDGTEQAEQDHADAVQADKDQEAVDYEWLMGDERGRRIVRALLDAAAVHQPMYLPGMDAMQMANRDGNRNQGLRMQALILKHCPGLYMVMIEETKPKGRN